MGRCVSIFSVVLLILAVEVQSFLPVKAESATLATVAHGESLASPVLWWNETYRGIRSDLAMALVQTTDRGYALAGRADSFGAGSDDFWLVRTLGVVTTITVPDDFSTIQEAINNAGEGSVIFVRSGVYHEHVVVNKTLSLVGENSMTTIVDGNWTGVVVSVTQSGVVVSDLTIRRSGSTYWENAGILLNNVENCSISENILTENSFAGLELNYSNRCTISGNSILNNGGVGVTLIGGSSNDLFQNSFAENGWSALTLNDGANGNTIFENNMTQNNQAVTDGHCINLYMSSDNSIKKNRITGDINGIRLEYSSNFNTISQNSITNNSGNGIAVDYSSNSNTLSENIITQNGYYGIGLHFSSNNIINGNNIANSYFNGIGVHFSPNTTIRWNNITENNGSAIWLDSSSKNSVFGNTIANNPETGVLVERNSDNNTISDNTISGSRFGVAVNGSRYVEICNNTIAHNHGSGWGTGVRLDSAGYTLIHDNEITDNWRAIHLITSSPKVSIYGNNVTYNEFGIRVLGGGSNYLNVSGNFIANNHGGYGVGVTGIGGESNYAVISGNVIINNIDGVALGEGSSYNTIVKNTINGNEYGIGMQSSTQNSIHSNNIVNNTQQVSITTGSVNSWNGSYSFGGNYWSDYSGLDQFNGPYQNVTGSDGIGDSPYVIDAANQDSYPLMTPWVPQVLTTDINNDGTVNIVDITLVAKAYASKPEDTNWNAVADLDKNGLVNIVDITLVAKDYGKTT